MIYRNTVIYVQQLLPHFVNLTTIQNILLKTFFSDTSFEVHIIYQLAWIESTKLSTQEPRTERENMAEPQTDGLFGNPFSSDFYFLKKNSFFTWDLNFLTVN